ncbi:MAG: ABC transporter substrate-binding protein [Alphaproteobacteria bacterium]|nr:ABC transporter substrate-binding protein [Alphaproteobacteria bacterium]
MKQSLLRGIAAMALLGGTMTATAAVSADLVFPVGEDSKFNWASYEEFANKYDLSGQSLTVFGPFTGDESALIENVAAYFAAATGATVAYAGSDSFEQQIVIDTQAGSAANIAAFPQPGLAADLASKGLLTALPDGMDQWVVDNYAAGQSWVDLGTYANQNGQDEFYGFFYKVDLKSLVWYSPDNFEDAGYEIPESLEELKALTDQIVADGETPWCIGLGSGAATGWPATDWVEEMMLRTQPPSLYDSWVSNETPFTDERIVAAIEEFGAFALNEDYVDGGVVSVGSTDFRDSPKGLFTSPPKCYMHRQASFIPAFFPEGTELGVDVDFFYFPAYESKDLGKPVLGAGVLYAITNPSPAANAFMDFLTTPIAHELWMAQGGFLTPYKEANVEAYASDALRGQGEILLNATTFRFDASDLMPGKIGAGSFWTGMVDYVGGKPATEVAAEIQATWDALK